MAGGWNLTFETLSGERLGRCIGPVPAIGTLVEIDKGDRVVAYQVVQTKLRIGRAATDELPYADGVTVYLTYHDENTLVLEYGAAVALPAPWN